MLYPEFLTGTEIRITDTDQYCHVNEFGQVWLRMDQDVPHYYENNFTRTQNSTVNISDEKIS